MTNEMKKEIAERIMNKVNLYRISKNDDPVFEKNKRFNPFYSEKVGMEQMLKMMGIEFEYEFDENLQIVAINIEGIRATA